MFKSYNNQTPKNQQNFVQGYYQNYPTPFRQGIYFLQQNPKYGQFFSNKQNITNLGNFSNYSEKNQGEIIGDAANAGINLNNYFNQGVKLGMFPTSNIPITSFNQTKFKEIDYNNSQNEEEKVESLQNNSEESGVYKCSCTKTQCNRLYCECFSNGRYCIGCNCKNCLNKPPPNSNFTHHITEHLDSKKKTEVTCTCTRSGCNKKYCECFKNGTKCTSACRCVKCENCDGTKKKNLLNAVELANSIYIVNNILVIDNVKKWEDGDDLSRKYIQKKRRRETKANENQNKASNKSLFDKNGKLVLEHVK